MLENQLFDTVVARKVQLRYMVYQPDGVPTGEKLPLVVFLHGAGERGDDTGVLARYGFLQYAAQGKKYPFIIAAPQCPNNRYWGNYLESLNDFLDHIIETYPVDTSRVYLTGLSMGGTGTWQWLMANPERFAAAAPVCGTGVYWYACRIFQKPLWIFHGALDDTVPVEESLNMVRNLRKSGGTPKLTVIENEGHAVWKQAYTDELADWLLQHRLED